MTPAARLAAAIEILDRVEAEGLRAEPALRDWGRAHRFAGSKDRAAIGDLLFEMLRKRRSLAFGLGEGARAAALGLAPELFGDGPHAPDPVTEVERAALAARPAPPDPVRLDIPDWLEGPLRKSLGSRFAPALLALRERAPLDLRVNALKAPPAQAAAALARDGVATEPAPLAPMGLRAAPGAKLAKTAAWRDGWIELQDAASQAAAALARARPGERVLDYCAGAGGKALALAATGAQVTAHDADPARMRDLPERAARAGARIRIARDPDGLEGGFDLVFVDAPCSGSGSWRRDPLGKWRLTPERLAELTALQPKIMTGAMRFLRPGGRMIYATCSLLREENEGALRRFLNDHPARRGETLTITPDQGADGFFAAELLF